MKFRKKPVIEAIQWHKISDHPEVMSHGNDETSKRTNCSSCHNILSEHGHIKTPEGWHMVCPGDWVIKGVKGELYPCKPDIFEQTYEPVE